MCEYTLQMASWEKYSNTITLQLMHKDRQGCKERLYLGGKILRPQNLNPFWFTKIHVFTMWTLFEEFL